MFGTKKNIESRLMSRSMHRPQPGGRVGYGELRLFRSLVPIIGAFAARGRLQVNYRDLALVEYGDGSGPLFRIRMNNLKIFPKIIKDPDLGCGECYVSREWDLEKGDLAGLIGMFCRNEAAASATIKGQTIRHISRLFYKARRNNPEKSRRHVAHHYDIGNDLYAAFLDEGMNYSCAFFETPDQSLRAAQLNKLRTTIRRIDIPAGARVLDIGCGWGELTRLIAGETQAGAVTGITLAERQRDLARTSAGSVPNGHLQYRLVDYRVHAAENAAVYDRIVSIGMFEHVGKKHFVEYFDAIRGMLAEGGQALVHSIMRQQRSETSPWIQKYIFPGGYIPTLEDTVAAAREAGLALAHDPFIHESFHYAETLRRWRRNFNDAWPRLDHARYDDSFRRMWNYYLASSEAGFDANGMFVGQLLLKKA